MSDPQVPKTSKEVNSEWLQTILQNAGVLDKDAKVSIGEKTPLEGGFNGTVLRLKVSYTKAISNLPESFVLKILTARAGDESNEKELYLYQNAEKLGFPEIFKPPKAYFAAKSGRSYIFLLEDLGNYKHIPQMEGAKYEEARRIVYALAMFHAKFWDSSRDAFSKLKKAYCPNAEANSYWESIQKHMETCIDDFNSLVNDDEVQKSAKFCASNFAALVKQAQEPPCTLIHGDARLSNYFLENGKSVIAVDWQGFNVGSGPGELAYFLSMNVEEEVRKKHENEFLHLYHDTITTHAKGAENFTFEACYHKYLIGVATTSAVPVLTARMVLEGRKHKDKPPTNPAMAETAKTQIAVHDNIKPMIDLWCATAHNHPITSIHLAQSSK